MFEIDLKKSVLFWKTAFFKKKLYLTLWILNRISIFICEKNPWVPFGFCSKLSRYTFASNGDSFFENELENVTNRTLRDIGYFDLDNSTCFNGSSER